MADFETGIRRFAFTVLINTSIADRVDIDRTRKGVIALDGCARLYYLGEGLFAVCSKNGSHEGFCGPQTFIQHRNMNPKTSIAEVSDSLIREISQGLI